MIVALFLIVKTGNNWNSLLILEYDAAGKRNKKTLYITMKWSPEYLVKWKKQGADVDAVCFLCRKGYEYSKGNNGRVNQELKTDDFKERSAEDHRGGH